MKRYLFITLIAVGGLIVALLLAATHYSPMLPLVIVFELLLLFTFGLRYFLIFRAFSQKRD